jgi:hypothetical protein
VGLPECSYSFAIANTAAINMGVQVPLLKADITLGISLGVVLLAHMADLFIVFKGPPFCFP